MNFPKFYNESRSHYAELRPREKLIYIYESQGNKLLEVYSIDEIQRFLNLKDFEASCKSYKEEFKQ